jgi:translation elongation factor EF-Tu-like GTPase
VKGNIKMLTIRAAITLLPSGHGGRVAAIGSGYRPNLRFGELYTDGSVQLVGRSSLSPGEACDADIALVNPDYVKDFLQVGAGFDITEGGRKIGAGTIHGLSRS